MIVTFAKSFEVLAALKDETARHVKELKTDDEKILRVTVETGEILDISDVECFIVNGTPRSIKETFVCIDRISP